MDFPASYVSLPEGRFFLTDFFQQLNAPKVYCYLIEVCFKKHWAQSFSSDLPLGRDFSCEPRSGGSSKGFFTTLEVKKNICFLTIPKNWWFLKIIQPTALHGLLKIFDHVFHRQTRKKSGERLIPQKRRIHCQITIKTGTVRDGNPQLFIVIWNIPVNRTVYPRSWIMWM